ncbi:hypothetical protein E3O11_09255 [Cryobacterium levicorallinum]|uniref:DUF11 domain-containing protein n=2 Tax=Cryobacterium levicorallinum TaxID=995038 RepID=A0A4R8VKI1_9MICO|nr:InlB B-repeat-containing protein [Cryobacterium levicorallinum]TFB84697.1 hypothetical protein E3O11_09255 [Cryobacterium levicorallinum]GEP28517.1 hypothetical protein CLE01_31150 [Cryobacterium levicorallinum]
MGSKRGGELYYKHMSDLPLRGFTRSSARIALPFGLIIALVSLLVFVPVTPVFAAGSPTGAVADAWPASWNSYRFSDGTSVRDTNTDQNPPYTDLASGACTGACVGSEATVQYAATGTTAFFRTRLATNPADNTKGGLFGGAFLTVLAVNDVVKAVVGVNGKESAKDFVYVTDSVGGTISTIYTYPFDNAGGQTSGGMRVVPAGDGSGQYFLDYQVPLSYITAISGNTITASTPIKLFYGSSAAANLSVINKDFMTGSAVNFANLSTVSFSPASLAVSAGAVIASGSNPPTEGATSSYSVTVSASNPGGGALSNAAVTIPVPSGVTVTSPSTGVGSITGSPLVWTIGSLLPGQTVTATFTASVTPSAGDVGANYTLVSAQSGSGTDTPFSATRTATGGAILVGPVAAAPAPVGSYTVSFSSAVGSPVADETVVEGDLATNPGEPSRAGYTFDGWFTAAAGGSEWDFTTPITGDTTLFAQWTVVSIVDPPATFTAMFNSNDGIGSMTAQSGSASGTLMLNTFTRAGYLFSGWNTAADGSGVPFADGTHFPFTSNTTLYAQWTPASGPVDESPDIKISLNLDLVAGDRVGGAPAYVSGYDLLEGSTYTVTLRSNPVVLLRGTVGSSGMFNTTVFMPAGVTPGQHTLTLDAVGVDGVARSRVVYITVGAEGTAIYVSTIEAETGDLAATGVDAGPLGLLALILLGLGAVLIRRRNRTVC